MRVSFEMVWLMFEIVAYVCETKDRDSERMLCEQQDQTMYAPALCNEQWNGHGYSDSMDISMSSKIEIKN